MLITCLWIIFVVTSGNVCHGQELTVEMMYNLLTRRIDNVHFNLKTELNILNERVIATEMKVAIMKQSTSSFRDKEPEKTALDMDTVRPMIEEELGIQANVVYKTLQAEKKYLRDIIKQFSDPLENAMEDTNSCKKRLDTLGLTLDKSVLQLKKGLENNVASISEIRTRLDKQGLGLTNGLQSTKSALQNVQTSVSTNLNRMDVLESDLLKANAALDSIIGVQKASFSARLSTSKYYISDGTKLAFDYVYRNDGYHYSPSTGIFTAPESGVYLFIFTVQAMQIADTISLACLFVEGSQKTCAVSEIWHNRMDIMGTNAEVVFVGKDQRVWIETFKTSRSSQNFFNYGTTFKGSLLYPSVQ